MPSGGNWTASEANAANQRPGFYANIVSAAGSAVSGGPSGIVASPVTADWGPLDSIVEIKSETELIATYGPSTLLGTAYYAIREALRGGAAKVLAFRMAGAAAAKATRILVDGAAATAITLTAKHEGARGNDFRITVATNALDGTKKDLRISEGGVLLETFTATTNALLVAAINATDGTGSKYVVAVLGGGAIVANVTDAPMTGGDSALTLLSADWVAATAAFEPQSWNVFGAVGLTDPTIQQTIFSWIKDLRNNGQKVMAVFGANTGESLATAITNAATFNHEGVIYLAWGVTDVDGVVRKGADYVGRVAGDEAAKGTEVSLTFQPVTGVRAIEQTPSNASVKSGIVGGLLMITGDGEGGFHYEKGINTLTTLTGTQTTQFKKIRIVRVLDMIFSALTVGLTGLFIGQMENDTDGQASVIASISAFMETLAAGNYIKPDFTVTLDPANPSVGDRLYLLIAVKPVDSIDYIYTSITVS